MADSDKNIVITPFTSNSTNDPQIIFSGADSGGTDDISMFVTFDGANATLSFEGSAGQLFSISNDLTGTIFSVNDVSGIPSIEVNDDGQVRLAEFTGNVMIGYATDQNTGKLQVNGDVIANGTITADYLYGDGSNISGIDASNASAIVFSDESSDTTNFIAFSNDSSGNVTLHSNAALTFDAANGSLISESINMGSETAASATDLSRHLALWGTTYGFNVTASTLNMVAAGTNFMSSTNGVITSRIRHQFDSALTIGGHNINDLDITSESSGADDHLMTALAIQNLITDNSDGFVTSVAAANGTIIIGGTANDPTVAVGEIGLGTDTTGNYVATVTGGDGITGNSSTEGGTPTIAVDSTVVRTTGTQSIAGAKTFTNNLFMADGDGIIIGHTAQLTNNGRTPELQILGTGTSTNSGDSSLMIGRYTNDTGGPVIRLAKSRNGSIGANTIVQSGDSMGSIVFHGADGNDIDKQGALILAYAEGTLATDRIPGRLEFQTAQNIATSPLALALTLDSSQNAIFAGDASAASFTLGGHTMNDIDITSENSNADDHLMTSLAINNLLDDSTIVRTSGNQTIAGDKRFSDNIVPDTDNTGVVGNASLTWNDGEFTNFRVNSTLEVRGTIDLADLDTIRFGASDDAFFFYDGTDNVLELELESSASAFHITDNTTLRFSFGKANGVLSATEFVGNMTTGGHTMNDIDITSENSNADDHLMTSLAINNLIGDNLDGYVTSVAAANGTIVIGGTANDPTIAVGEIVLGTDTTGNYVATITNGDGITGSSATEGGTPTIAVDSTVVRTTGVQSIGGDKTFTSNVFFADDQHLIIGHDAVGLNIGGTTDGHLQVIGDGTGAHFNMGRFQTNSSSPDIRTVKSRNANPGSFTIVQDNDELFRIRTFADDGVDYQTETARIAFNVDDGTPATGAIGGEILISTATTAGALTTSLRIDNSQNVYVDGSNIALYRGNSNVHADYFVGTATMAQYADVAEKYECDDLYEPGTVMVFGGDKEITQSFKDYDHAVAGVLSTDPAIMMNSNADGQYLALVGRVPCKVVGPVNKGDLLVTSNTAGHAKSDNTAGAGHILGKAIESTEKSFDTIEVLVNLM